jgi:hypothetical protein
MNTITMKTTGGTRLAKLLTGVLAAGLVLGLTACRTTHQVRGTPEESGFLKDYSQLHEGESGEAKLVYINTNADWAKFTRINIKPVELWKSDDPDSKLGKLSQEKQQMLIDYAYTALSNSLAKNFLITDQMGPDVLVVHAAITEAKKCKPVINLVSSVMPIGIAISLVRRGIFGTGSGVGICQGEIELLDGGTGDRVAAAVDRRAGTKAIRTKFNGRFGDVKEAMDYWAEHLDERLMKLREGQKNGDL